MSPLFTIRQGKDICLIFRLTFIRLYDSQNVFQVFELINKWLTELRENNKTVPTTFDYNFFFKGKLILFQVF